MMNGMIRRRATLARATCSLAFLAALAGGSAEASTWAGSSAGWGSNGNPGWNGSGVPNLAGAVATFALGSSATTTQDTGSAVIVGTLSTSGSGNASWTITNTNGLTLNQDDGDSGFATIENGKTTNGGHGLIITGGTLTLADNLLISNTSSSSRANGAVDVGAAITGTGNITLSNISNTPAAGAIRIAGANSFTGTVNIQQGAVIYTTNSKVFGTLASNTVTLGSVGAATLQTASAAGTTPNNFVIAATAGTKILGSTSTGNNTYSGTITLNGDLSVTSASTSTSKVLLSGIVSGTGALTKIGAGNTSLSGVNTYTGNTTVSVGSLTLEAGGETRFKIQNGGVSNQILGSGTAIFNGLFRLDASALGSTSGTWHLVDAASLAETYGGTFGVAFAGGPTFDNAGGGVYTSGNWSFTQSTGDLVLIPEPAGLALAGSAGLLLLRRRKRA